MNIREILNQSEKNLSMGYKSKVYSDLSQITQAYEQLYNDHESEQKKLKSLSARNEELKSTNETMLLKVINNETMDWNTKPNNQTKTPGNGIKDFLEGIEI